MSLAGEQYETAAQAHRQILVYIHRAQCESLVFLLWSCFSLCIFCIDVGRKWYKHCRLASMSIWKHVLFFYCYSSSSSLQMNFYISIFLLHWSHFFTLSFLVTLSLEAKILGCFFFYFSIQKAADDHVLTEQEIENKHNWDVWCAWIVKFTYVNCRVFVCVFCMAGTKTYTRFNYSYWDFVWIFMVLLIDLHSTKTDTVREAKNRII